MVNDELLIDLDNYLVLKKKVLVDNFNASSLEDNKNNLLQALFNISLEEEQFINNKFCHSADMLESFKESELRKENRQHL